MKYISVLSIILLFSLLNNRDSNVQMSINNKYIKDGKRINFQIINNSNIDYCFILDTLFPERNESYYYYENAFLNPKLIVSDSKNKKGFLLIRDIENGGYESGEFVNAKKNTNTDNLVLIFIKSKKSAKFNMPFDFIRNPNDGTIIYYKLNKKEKYKCKIEYKIKKEFYISKLPKKTQDSIQDAGFEFFTGSLKSNRVPLVF